MIFFFFFFSESEEDRKWFMEAMQAQTVDVIRRLKEITMVLQTPEQVLESQGVTPQDLEGRYSLTKITVSVSLCFGGKKNLHYSSVPVDMLDELQEHVEPIDMANGEFPCSIIFLRESVMSSPCDLY